MAIEPIACGSTCLRQSWWLAAVRSGKSNDDIESSGHTGSSRIRSGTADPGLKQVAAQALTFAPWQLFFQQSCVADKRLRLSDLRWARLDTFVGFRVLQLAGVIHW